MTSNSKDSRLKLLLKIPNWLILVLSIFAMGLSIYATYNKEIKPFALDVRVDPHLYMQHKINFGLYVSIDMQNISPNRGMVTQMVLIMYKAANPLDKYLIKFNSFRFKDVDDVWSPTEEQLPIYFLPNQIQKRTASFIYSLEGNQFPLATGTYKCELLIWTLANEKADLVREFTIEITEDLMDTYKEYRNHSSTNLIPLTIAGYTELKAGKLSEIQYHQLK